MKPDVAKQDSEPQEIAPGVTPSGAGAFTMTFEVPRSPIARAFEGTIYHYADEQALIGILESKGLWASAIGSLNDRSELEYGRALIRDVWDSDLGSLHDDDMASSVQSSLDVSDDLLDADRVFVACASERSDDLGQFRNYGRYSLGLSAKQFVWPEKLRWGFPDDIAIRSHPPGWRRVIYDVEEQRDAARSFLTGMSARIDVIRNRHGGGWVAQPNEITALTFAWWYSNLVPLLKFPAFEQEREVRLVIATNEEFKDVRFRPSDLGVVPYVIANATEEKFPLVSVKVGPTRFADTALAGARALVRHHGYDIDVSASETPLRA